jgi:hypothetical protein
VEAMKVEQANKQDGKVFEVRDVNIQERFRSQGYVLSTPNTAVISSTGLLTIFELRPISGKGPSFVGRWDGGSRDEGKTQRDDLDIDIKGDGVNAEVTLRFKRGEDGYSGHWTKHVPSTFGHAYDVSIRIPGETIFDGTVCFSVHRKIEFAGSVSFRATLDTRNDS